jgi:uncharacterized protein
MPPQTFFDIAVIHLLTTSTITVCGNYIQKADLKFDVLGPNIVVESAYGEKDFIENLWIGKNLTVGEDVVLKVTGPCTRCYDNFAAK